MIKHIFSDMDGTLLNERGNVTPTTIKALKQCKIPVTLVSARAPMEMAPVIKRLGLKGPQIAFNGGLIFQRNHAGWRAISESAIDTEVAAALIHALSISFTDISISYYSRDRWYSSRMDFGIQYEQRITRQRATVMPQRVAFNQPNFRVFKIMLIVSSSDQMMAVKQFLKHLAIPGISVQQSGTTYLEITSIDAKKSRGIDYILTKEQLHAHETAGFGDGHNDLPMLNIVGVPIVMDNALAEIKTVAKHVTKSNRQNGIAYALKMFPEFQR